MAPKVKIGDKILEILATAGVVGFAALCEGMRDARWVSGGYTDYRVKRSLSRLQNRDLVVKIKTTAGTKWQLTPEGKFTYDKNNLGQIKINKPEMWDGKWRVVVFDIPEDIGRSVRDGFRRRLNEMGFVMTQKSVYISRWPCAEEIKKTIDILGISQYVSIFEGNFLHSNKDYLNNLPTSIHDRE